MISLPKKPTLLDRFNTFELSHNQAKSFLKKMDYILEKFHNV